MSMKDQIYQHSGAIKRILILFALILIFVLLHYSQGVVTRLREDSTNYVRFFKKIYVKAIIDPESREFDFIFDEIIEKIPFPMIISSQIEDEPTSWRGIDLKASLSEEEQRSQVLLIMHEMDRTYEPITLDYKGKILGYIHYGDTKLIRQLRMLPYIEIGVVGLFIFLGYFGFQVIRGSEKRLIWIGMAKETAHQLGTPLSSMMGWTELLKAKCNSYEELDEMTNDLERLEKVSTRFSKIGSKPSLKEAAINPIIHDAVVYYKKRLPRIGPRIRLDFDPEKNFTAMINTDLFSWALENLIRNAIDAVTDQNGSVRIVTSLVKKDQFIAIDVIDNGKGIPKRDRQNIFRPGFSTKKRGWGLGLSLARRIVEEYHKGKIFVLESRPFEKTVLRILLQKTPAQKV